MLKLERYNKIACCTTKFAIQFHVTHKSGFVGGGEEAAAI